MGLLGRVIKYSTAGKSFEECWKVELLKESGQNVSTEFSESSRSCEIGKETTCEALSVEYAINIATAFL